MRIDATLLKFGEDSRPDAWGDVVRFAPDSLYTDDHQALPLLMHHQQQLVAVGYATRLWVEGDLLRAEFTMLDTSAGLDAQLELAADVRKDISVAVLMDEYDAEPVDPDAEPTYAAPQRLTVTLADTIEASLCFRGRMPSAMVNSVHPDEGATA